MKSRWGKQYGCKFASDAVFRGDWVALHGLMLQGGISADCPFPSNERREPVKIVTWARRFNSTHPNRDLVKHELEADLSFGTPLLHQAVIAEGITNKMSFRPGVKLLLDMGADINLQDKANGYTALHFACMLCRTSLIDYLLEKGAKRDIKAKNGKNATEMMPRWCKTVIKPSKNGGTYDYEEEEDEEPAKLPSVKVDSTVDLEALMNITVGDPRLSDEGDLEEPILWRQNVSEDYWKRLMEEDWFRPFLYCVALVDGKLVIYELPSTIHELIADSIPALIFSEQALQDPAMVGLGDRIMPAYLQALPGALIIADDALCPKSCNDAAQGYPSIVVEVGVSQSLQSLQQKARDWFACVHAGVNYVQLVILVKVSRSLNRFVQGHRAVRVSCYLWMRYDPLLHAPLLPFINARLPGGGPVVPNQAVCIAEFECGDYAAHAQQNLPANHNRMIRIPRYALYARSPAYVAAAAQVPPPIPLFPPGSPYHGDLTIDLWTNIINILAFRQLL